MTALATTEPQALSPEIMEMIVQGDISKLDTNGRLTYYNTLCDRLGIDPAFQPFGYLVLSNRLVLYANKACAEQLRKRHAISVEDLSTSQVADVYIVKAHLMLPSGRKDTSTGAVSIGNLKGDALANALMKAETKAKRRGTLSIMGLGMLDETEIETIPGARIVPTSEAQTTMLPPDEAPPPPPPKRRGRTPKQTADDGNEVDEERAACVRKLFGLIETYAEVGGERGVDLKARMHDTEARHKLVFDMYGKHRLRDLDADELHNFIAKVERRVDEATVNP